MKKPAWWGVIFAGILAGDKLINPIFPVESNPLQPDQVETVPGPWLDPVFQKLDSVIIENEKLIDSIDYLNRTPIVLDINNLTQPPASFRSIAVSLEYLIDAGAVVESEMLLRIANASFAIGDYERAERFIWRVPVDDPYFAIAMRNCGVLYGVYGDFEGLKKQFDYAELLRRGAFGDVEGSGKQFDNVGLFSDAEE